MISQAMTQCIVKSMLFDFSPFLISKFNVFYSPQNDIHKHMLVICHDYCNPSSMTLTTTFTSTSEQLNLTLTFHSSFNTLSYSLSSLFFYCIILSFILKSIEFDLTLLYSNRVEHQVSIIVLTS